jgi:peptidoglycan hydrolase-like protein with peptidoglycan-binding domain
MAAWNASNIQYTAQSEEARMKALAIAAVAIASLPAITLPAAPLLAQASQQTGADTSKLNMDAVPSLSEDKVRRVQQALQTKGFDPGPIDGVIGPKTEDALRNFQDRYGIKTSAKVDNQTLYALGAPDLAGPESETGQTPR